MSTETENEASAAAVIQDIPIDYPQPEFQPVPVVQSPTHTALFAAVAARTHEILTPVGTPPDLVAAFGEAFAEEIDNMLAKFAAGQLKHGGDIRDRDLVLETTQEARDLMNYLICMRLQRLCIRVPIA